MRSWWDILVGNVLALHATDPDSFPFTPYGPLGTLRSAPWTQTEPGLSPVHLWMWFIKLCPKSQCNTEVNIEKFLSHYQFLECICFMIISKEKVLFDNSISQSGRLPLRGARNSEAPGSNLGSTFCLFTKKVGCQETLRVWFLFS